MVAKKTCPACGKRLSVEAFNASARTPDGFAGTCRACTNSRRRERDRLATKKPRRLTGASAVASALRIGDLKSVKRLLRTGAAPHWGWVCETMREGHLALAEFLLERGVERNIFTMAAIADVSGLKRRLARMPDEALRIASIEPASERVTPLHVGCASDWRSHGARRMADQVQVAAALLDRGADPDAVGRYRGIGKATPLLCACWSSGNPALVRRLLEQGARAGEEHLLAALGHLQRHSRAEYKIAEALFGWGVPIDGNKRGGRTPLQAFAHQGVRRTVEWLISHGAEVNRRGPGGRMAAHFASERNTTPTTLALLAANKADLAARDDDGRTPLEIAKLNGKTALVSWLKQQMNSPSLVRSKAV